MEAHIRELSTLHDLHLDLGRFRDEAKEALFSAEAEIAHVEEWLQDRLRYWRREVEHCEEDLDDSQRALEDCRNSEDEDYYPDCSGYEEELDQSRHRLGRAQDELSEVQRSLGQFEEAVSDYRSAARKLDELAETGIEQARAFLQRKLTDLEAYAAISAPAAGAGVLAESRSPSVQTAVPDPVSASGPAPPTASSGWIERGIQSVPIGSIDLSDSSVRGAGDFKKYSHDVLLDGVRRLRDEVQPAVERGADGDYFSDLDSRNGTDYEHGLRRVYDSFYGMERIRLTKIGDKCTVENGYHRLTVAKELGLHSIPASVVEASSGRGENI
jgi:hypothetical protein